jgi:uncharacterized protein (DUF885 family)
MRQRSLSAILAILITISPTIGAAQKSPSPDQAIALLANAFVAEYERRFPFAIMEAGLPLASQSGININSARDLARWRRYVRSIEDQLGQIPEAELVGHAAWITRAYLLQAIAQERSEQVCRSELWKISPYEWVFRLPRIADAQPVATGKDRRQALQRWNGLAAWIDRDAMNLATGLRAGFSGLRGGVEAEIAQIDAFIAAPQDQWPTAVLAKRAANEVFARQLNEIETRQIIPAAKRYRDFLRDVYVPKARSNPSILGQPMGAECLRTRLAVSTTIEMDPKVMFEVLVARRQQEHLKMLELGREAYGVKTLDWEGLGQHVIQDPRNHFRDAGDIHSTLEAVISRARAALPRMVTKPPSGELILNPFPQYAEASSPAGEFFPASDDGTRPPTFSYRANPTRFRGVTAESLVMHETIPGHYLQAALLRNSETKLHPIARLVYAEGPREGWATYAESWAAELGLYSGPFDEMGSLLNSVTPAAIADLGMQVMGWDVEKAAAFLHDEWPFGTLASARESASGLASSPGLGVEPYPMGALQYEAARKRAQEMLGDRFDSREFHQMLLSDGALPFAALNTKIDRWISDRR